MVPVGQRQGGNMETQRNSQDLINELDAAASQFWVVAIAVGFEDHSVFVFNRNAKRLEELNGFLEQGGNPIGLIGVVKDADVISIHTKVFEEFASEEWAENYLAALISQVAESLKEKYEEIRNMQVRFSKGWIN
jgi:hypothetical protein